MVFCSEKQKNPTVKMYVVKSVSPGEEERGCVKAYSYTPRPTFKPGFMAAQAHWPPVSRIGLPVASAAWPTDADVRAVRYTGIFVCKSCGQWPGIY